jgi:glycosyltransferase involved in cell wall biosynthesis
VSVSVCIATIPPRKALLERALASVEVQLWPPDETIVQVDRDGEGAGPTRNKAWRRATSEFVAFLDDDDEFNEDHLARCVMAAYSQQADVVYPWFELYDEMGNISSDEKLACPVNGMLRSPLGVAFGPEQARHMRQHAFIPATILVRRSMLEAVGGYPSHDSEEYERYRQCEDWALLNRLLDIHAKFVHVPHRTWRLHLGAGVGGQSWRAASR